MRPRPRHRLRPRGRRAVALILTLWLIVIMTTIAYSTLFEANINVELTRSARDRFYARVAARSGVGRAMVDLLNDKRFDMALAESGERPYDALSDPWASVEDDYVDVEASPGFYTVQVMDEERFFPVNSRSELAALMALFDMLGMKEEEDRERAAAAIIDYIDYDATPRFNNAEEDTEDAAYRLLISEDLRLRRDEEVAYRKKNDAIQWVDEFADIYGMSPRLFYGSEWTGEDDKRLSWRRPRYYGDRYGYDDRDYIPGFRELVSVRNEGGGVNINTARPEVLHALLGAGPGGSKVGEDAAKKILSERPQPRGGRNPNSNDAFTSSNALQDAGVDTQALSLLRQSVRVQVVSNTFRVVSEGRFRESRHLIEAVFKRDWDAFQRDDSRGLDSQGGRGGGRSSRASGTDEEQLIQGPALRAVAWREE